MTSSVEYGALRQSSTLTQASSITKIGINAWCKAHSRRVAIIVDAADYYRYLEEAFKSAQKSILIAGWDFNGRIMLRPDRRGPEELGRLLLRLVEAKSTLVIHILIWASGPIYSGRQMRFFTREPWAQHPRIKLCYDSRHPWRGSHHQKIVCIDDSLAFSGGIDLTIRRWDTSRHLVHDVRRKDPDGKPYDAVHDVQIAVDHEAAKSLADLVRARWSACNASRIAALETTEDLWPESLKPDLRDTFVSIARTMPGTLFTRGVREIESLNEAALKSARHLIYIETQYLTCRKIGALLARKLADPNGPEITIVVPKESHGHLERIYMGGNRDRLVRRLQQADIFKRLRVVYPAVQDPETLASVPVFVHSKVLVVDDVFLRIGSSNFNNRSRGMDSECDVALETNSSSESEAISRMRNSLIGEHLGLSPLAVNDHIRRCGSIITLIDAKIEKGQRWLTPLCIDQKNGTRTPIPLTSLFDPATPFRPLRYILKLARAFRSRTSMRDF
ncbi:phospholipase D-like domain-containing protein [Phyllobacterium sp. K27]